MFIPLELTLRPSRVYRLIMVSAHSLALAGIWLAALPVWIKALMAAVLLIGGVWLWRENSTGPRALRVTQSGQIELLEGDWLPASIKGQAVVLPWFVNLTLALESGKTHRLALLPDSTEADGFRKLRVWLKWATTTG